jgi:replication-associated recombination protein RarA
MNLPEKYRPRCLEEVLAQDKAKAMIRTLTARSWGGRGWWITGQSGAGKTTLAHIIAQQGADKFNVREIVARQLTPSIIAELQRQWMYVAMGDKPGYCLIVNEAHGLTKPVIEILLDVIENLRDNVCIIFTTTRDGNDLFEEQLDSSPFASRCIQLSLASRGLCEPFAKRVQEIAEKEGLNGKPFSEYIKLLKEYRNNFRAALQAVESGRMA